MAQLQHWVVNCTTCDSPAEYHCNTCGDILCPRCREIHQRSRGTGHHSIVPYSERIEPGKLTGQCDDHPGSQCMLWCQRCDKAACPLCVTSPDHESHKFIQMTSKIEEQKKVVREEYEYYTKLLKSWEDSLQNIQSSMKGNENDVDKLSKDITREADRMCDQIRLVEATLLKKLQEMKNSQTSILHDQETTLQNGITEIKQQIKTAEDTLRSENVGRLLQYKVQGDKATVNKPPETDIPLLLSFKPGEVDTSSLEKMLGNLSFENKGADRGKKVEKSTSCKPVSKEAGVLASRKKDFHQGTSGNAVESRKMSLSSIAVVTLQVQTEKSWPPYLACTGSGQAWVRTESKILKLRNKDGTVDKTINTGFYNIGSMTITSQGDLLLSDNKSIKLVSKDGEISALFDTEYVPFGMCCVENGDVVLSFYLDGRVAQYSRDGKVVKELKKSLFKHPRNVAQNRINKHLYVCDKSSKAENSPGRMLAVNMVTGKLEYDYTGSDKKTFTPWDVCSDQAGHVIITDYSNDRIHILDQDGKFLQFLMTKDRGRGLYKPFCIDSGNDGYAWVGEWERSWDGTSQVKVLKYMN